MLDCERPHRLIKIPKARLVWRLWEQDPAEFETALRPLPSSPRLRVLELKGKRRAKRRQPEEL